MEVAHLVFTQRQQNGVQEEWYCYPYTQWDVCLNIILVYETYPLQFWTALSPISGVADLGITGKYMGKTQEYMQLAERELPKYLYNTKIPNMPSINAFDRTITSFGYFSN